MPFLAYALLGMSLYGLSGHAHAAAPAAPVLYRVRVRTESEPPVPIRSSATSCSSIASMRCSTCHMVLNYVLDHATHLLLS